MKAKVLTRINAILLSIIGMLGFTSCEQQVKYGVPVETDATDTEIRLMYGAPAPMQMLDAPDAEDNTNNE